MSRVISMIEVESSHGTREIALNTHHLMNGIIFINGSIDRETANDFISQLLYLEENFDGLVNIFLTQTMNELCRVADRECKNNCLPVPVRFILDDFATNCKIEEFPRMIASIRSRGISTMLMIQAESQLTENYGYDGKTIIGNCDTYVYLGGNDIETAKAVAERCCQKIL